MKKIISLTLAVVMLMMLVPATVLAANTYVINGKTVAYTDFVSYENGCWDYANNLYNKIWGKRFSNQFGDVDNSLRNLSDEELILNVEHLKAYVSNAVPGAVLRVCDAQYLHSNDGWGHSQLIAKIDANGFIVLEGGVNGVKNYHREKYYTWSEYCSKVKYKYIKYIKWPGAEPYSPISKQVRDYLKKCEFTPSSYEIKAVKEANLRNMPCNTNTDAASKIEHTLPVGTKFTATGIYKNTEGNYWYRVLYKNNEYYLYAKNTTALNMINDTKITGAKFPTTLQKGSAFTLEGVVSSKYIKLNSLMGQIFSSSGKLVGSKTVSVSNNSYSIKNSALDTSLKFGSLAAGEYRLMLIADVSTSFVTDKQKLSSTGMCVTVLEKTFTVHEHKFVSAGTESKHPHRTMTKCSCGEVKYGNSNYTKKVKVTSPTCYSEGKEETVCNTCGYVESTKTLPKTAHAETYEKITDATCSAEGKIEYLCRICNEVVKTESVPALDHKDTMIVTTDATCLSEGAVHEICKDCGMIVSTKILEKKEHTVELINVSSSYTGDEYCTACKTIIKKGEEIEITYTFGDVNNDGSVDAKDATQILRSSNGKASFLDNMDNRELIARGDINGDGSVDAKDATQILRFVNGKASYLSK